MDYKDDHAFCALVTNDTQLAAWRLVLSEECNIAWLYLRQLVFEPLSKVELLKHPFRKDSFLSIFGFSLSQSLFCILFHAIFVFHSLRADVGTVQKLCIPFKQYLVI